MGISYIIPVLLGLLSGWLVNYFSDVLPYTRSLSRPACHHCEHTFTILDYLLLRSCASCNEKRGLRTYAVMVVAVIATLVIWIYPPATLKNFYVTYVLFTYLGVILVIDMEHRLILHPTSIFGAVLGLFVGIYSSGWKPTLVGGAVGFGIMYALYLMGILYLKWMAKRQGEETDEVALGYGDVNFSGIMGLILGWPAIVGGILIALLAGGMISLVVLLAAKATRRYHSYMALPYAPFLIFATIYILYNY